MSIKDMISNAISNMRGRKEKYREMDENYRLEKTLHERQLSPNERELMKYREEQRQKIIDYQVKKFRKQKQGEFWHGNKVYEQKPLFNRKDGKTLLKQKNIFK
jgi:hypothetical protein